MSQLCLLYLLNQYLFPPQMLVQLWPYINDMVVKILKEQVEPEIQKNVPGFLSSIHFEEISLGEVVSQTHILCILKPTTLRVIQ